MKYTSNDITDRKQAEDALRKSEERYRQLVEQIQQRLAIEEAIAHASRLFVSLAVDVLNEVLKVIGQSISVNRAYIFQLRENGRKMDNTHEWCEFGTDPQINNLQDLDSDLFPWWMKKLEKDENIIIPDVSALPAEAAAEKEILQAQDIRSLLVVPIRLTTGTLAGFMGFDDTEKCREWSIEDAQVLRVVTEMVGIYWERKQSEVALRKSEEKYRTIFETTGTATIIIEEDMTISLANAEFEKFSGYSKEEIENKKSWTEFFIKDDLDKMKKYHRLRRIDPNAAPRNYESRFIDKQGNIRNTFLTAAIIPGTKKSMMSLLDITDRKRAVKEIKKLNKDLERRVAMRTAQLKAANKELETFCYSVSHDLRAPLRGIDGFSQALLDDYEEKLEEQGKDYLRRIRAASQRMSQLIDDLLELSRVTRSEMSRKTVNLSAIAQAIAEDLQKIQPERRVEFVIAPGLMANGDERLLRVVLTNLLDNAWKFTSRHRNAIIEFNIKEHNGKPVFFVSDDGAGFDMAYAPKLFGAFQRLHAMTEFSGTGIGLATVQRIINRHGGRVWAEGEVEQGATFYFTL